MNNKASISGIVAIVGILIVLLILAPVMLKVITIPLNKFTTALSPISNQSAEAVNFGTNKINSLFDIVIVVIFFFNIILMLISSFLIDIHPAFLIVYVVAGFILFMIIPSFEAIAGAFLDNTNFSDVVAYLPMTYFLYTNFAKIMVGVFFITGIVMFAKFRGAGGMSNTGASGY
jgi:hypothetical protein